MNAGFLGQIDFEGEQCDDGDANSDELADACRSNCQRARCGDGVEDTGEACDDGDRDNADGCLNLCEVAECGDGILRQDLQPGDAGYEECDDNNLDDDDGCSLQCVSGPTPYEYTFLDSPYGQDKIMIFEITSIVSVQMISIRGSLTMEN